MLHIADVIRRVLIPFLLVAGIVVLLLLLGLLIARAIDEIRFRRRQRLIAKCRPLVDALLLPRPPSGLVKTLGNELRGHRDVLTELLIAPARVATGGVIDVLRAAAAELGLIDRWRRELTNRRWWVRADAARSLGLLKEPSSVDLLVATLDDDHEEVRAAGVEGLTHILDPRTVPVLVSKLPDQSRHQRVRLIEALHRFGSVAVAPVLAYEREHPEDRAMLAQLLGVIADPAAIEPLARWMDDERSPVRAAAMQALGLVGVDQRTYYHALRALSSDSDPEVRAMAAWALGRSGRKEAAPYLAKRLQDEWIVAAHSATALRALGAAGIAVLRGVADDKGVAGDLARQILFEVRADGQQLGVSA
jgi:HEAT repeat protein